MQSTAPKPKRSRRLVHPQVLLINMTVLGYSLNKDQILAQPSDTRSTYLSLEEQSNYSVGIKLKGLSGILRITWTPGEYRPDTQQRRRNIHKNSTSDTSSKPGRNAC